MKAQTMCPDWCRTNHTQHRDFHGRSLLSDKRFDSWEVPTSVWVTQLAPDADGATLTAMHARIGRPDDPREFPPRSHSLTVTEARALRDGLTAAIELMEAVALATCPCGEPLVNKWEAEDGLCCICTMAANQARAQANRSRLSIVGGAV